ncbi:MAG: hypothetical protein FWG64_01015 [Firmicutes bacterium]|nr:hypothetical protein [Bacillota bacterium]
MISVAVILAVGFFAVIGVAALWKGLLSLAQHFAKKFNVSGNGVRTFIKRTAENLYDEIVYLYEKLKYGDYKVTKVEKTVSEREIKEIYGDDPLPMYQEKDVTHDMQNAIPALQH